MDAVFRRMCRACMCRLEHNFHSIQDQIEDKTLRVHEMIATAAPQLPPLFGEPDLPECICSVCFNKLNIAYAFQQMCIASDKRLRQMLAEYQRQLHKDLENKHNVVLDKQQTNLISPTLQAVVVKLNVPSIKNVMLTTNDANINIPNEIAIDDKKYAYDINDDDEDPLLRRMLTPELELHNIEQLADEVVVVNAAKSKNEPNDSTWSDDERNVEKAKSTPKQNFKKTLKSVVVGEAIDDANNSLKRFECPECQRRFVSEFSLKCHFKVHDVNRPFPCQYCKCRFLTQSHLTEHISTFHGIHRSPSSKIQKKIIANGFVFKCCKCEQTFVRQESLNVHMRKFHHHETTITEMFQCAFCSHIFTNLTNLKTHIAAHLKNQNYKCQVCEKTFTDKSKLLLHLNTHDALMKSYSCNICDKSFQNKIYLKHHLRRHTDGSSFLCSQCGKTFKTLGCMRDHALRHSEHKTFECSDCPQKFSCRANLWKHRLVHTNPKSHICDICGAAFSRTDSLAAHKFRHTGERPFKCAECGMAFSSIKLQRQHMRTHTGEKPYKCKFCERAYACNGDLNKHLRTHLGENTYSCDECPETFKYQTELRSHKSEHYKKKRKLLQQQENE